MLGSFESKGTALRRIRSSEGFIVGVVSLALFTDTFIYGMVIPVIPQALVERAGILEQDAQYWIAILLAVYGATVLIGSPIFGYLADYTGSRKLSFVLGLLALGTSTGLFMLGRTPSVLIVARALQGFSAAAVWVVGTALVVDTVAQDRIGQALGRTTTGLTWGGVLGPMLGGVTYEKWGYYGTFYIPIGLIVLDILLRFSMIEPLAAQKKAANVDRKAQKGKAVCTDGFPDFPNGSLSSPTGQKWREADEETPLLNKSSPPQNRAEKKDGKTFAVLRLLVTTTLWVALLAAMIFASIFSALETTLPLFVIQTFHWSSSGAGLIFLALSLPSFTADLIGRWVDRAGARIPGTIAFTLSAFAIFFLRFVQHDSAVDQALLIGLLFLVGITIVIAQVAFMTEVSRVVDTAVEERPELFGDKSPVAQAYGLFNMAMAAGQMLGPSVGGSIKARAGWEVMTLVIGGTCALTALLIGLSGGSQVK